MQRIGRKGSNGKMNWRYERRLISRQASISDEAINYRDEEQSELNHPQCSNWNSGVNFCYKTNRS